MFLLPMCINSIYVSNRNENTINILFLIDNMSFGVLLSCYFTMKFKRCSRCINMNYLQVKALKPVPAQKHHDY